MRFYVSRALLFLILPSTVCLSLSLLQCSIVYRLMSFLSILFFIIAFYCNVAAYENFRGPLGNVRKGVLVCLVVVILT